MLKQLETTQFAPELNIPGLTLRNWRGDSDYEHLAHIYAADKQSQGMEEASTVSEIKAQFESLPSMDMATGAFLLEHDGEVIAYQNLRSYPEAGGAYCYNHHGYVMPAWKGRGIGRALIQHGEEFLTRCAPNHPADAPKFFQVYLESAQTGLENLLTMREYTPVRYFYTMVRPNLDDIPEAPLPAGIQVRPVTPEQYHQIWQADVDAFKEHWGETDHDEADYQRWLKRPLFQPELWQVAWDGDRIAGLVTNEISESQNATFNRRRGATDDIATLKEYRGRGLAKALIARGLRQFKALGMTDATLDVDTENASGALQLYFKMGYQPTKTTTAFRKPLVLG